MRFFHQESGRQNDPHRTAVSHSSQPDPAARVPLVSGTCWSQYTSLRPHEAEDQGVYRARHAGVGGGVGREGPSGPTPLPWTHVGTTARPRSPRDYYMLLGIGRDATTEQLERAFRRYVRQNHPDLVFGDPIRHPVAQARLKEVLGAMRVLRDPVKRAQYDAKLDHLPLSSRLGPPVEVAD